MIVTFRCKAHADIMMFGDNAIQLLKLMGHSGAVPGALLADEVPAALDRLRKSVASHQGVVAETSASVQDDDDEPNDYPVNLAQRALPLIELLTDSAKAKCDVMWDQ